MYTHFELDASSTLATGRWSLIEKEKKDIQKEAAER